MNQNIAIGQRTSSQICRPSGGQHGLCYAGLSMLFARRLRDVGAAFAALLFATNIAAADVVRIGVSNYVYEDIARQVGGSAVAVTVLRQAQTARFPALDFVICGCSHSDDWLRDAARRQRTPVPVIEALQKAPGHRSQPKFPWYDVPAMEALSHRLAAELTRRLPTEAPRIAANAARTFAAFHMLDRRIDEIAKDYANSDVFLADGLYRGMIERLRFNIRNEAFLETARPGSLPSATSTANLKREMQLDPDSIFLFDRDVAGAAANELKAVAEDSGIPVVALREQLPKGLHYQQWMLRQMNAVHGALNEASP